ncbi:hypothetical protein [Streptomyces sp. ISL-86]|uniref:hypothetical protein n=1 Tax=Streptomyces sp. ISL-86 TaxID=2819187 RepID=UPI001BEA2BEB|nr:hypothetical protein [Streptomyces sp. ISL-86]MBT2458872.1 hypothetical protein [Streptomyces sp. ISL-86]
MSNIRRWIARSGVALAGAGLAVGVVASGSAFADMDIYESGEVHSWRTGSGAGYPNGMAAVMDTLADGNEVYTSYNRNYPDSTVYTLFNKSGSGTTAYSNGGGRIWDMKACTSVDYLPDHCSDWWTDNFAHG